MERGDVLPSGCCCICSSLVADPIDHLTKVLSLPERTTQGGWVRVWVPQDSPAGIYEGKVILKDGDKTLGELILKINVKDRILPMPSEWTYHLDLWQNPVRNSTLSP